MNKPKKPKSLLLKRYHQLIRREGSLAGAWSTFHAVAKAGGCLHEITRSEKSHNDNGYGKWWTTFLTVCVFCEAVLEKHTEDGCK